MHGRTAPATPTRGLATIGLRRGVRPAPGGGAEPAWWHLSAVREDAYHAEQDIPGAAIDIYTCFDQVAPLLGQTLLHLAGMPWSILRPYSEIMQHVRVINVLPQGAGTPF